MHGGAMHDRVRDSRLERSTLSVQEVGACWGRR